MSVSANPGPSAWRMKARAKWLFPAPSSPDSRSVSPGSVASASRRASASVVPGVSARKKRPPHPAGRAVPRGGRDRGKVRVELHAPDSIPGGRGRNSSGDAFAAFGARRSGIPHQAAVGFRPARPRPTEASPQPVSAGRNQTTVLPPLSGATRQCIRAPRSFRSPRRTMPRGPSRGARTAGSRPRGLRGGRPPARPASSRSAWPASCRGRPGCRRYRRSGRAASHGRRRSCAGHPRPGRNTISPAGRSSRMQRSRSRSVRKPPCQRHFLADILEHEGDRAVGMRPARHRGASHRSAVSRSS